MPYLIQGVDGPNGDDCVPEGWKFDRYYSPGQCPSGYKACTLPTVTQRIVTTEICCPRYGFLFARLIDECFFFFFSFFLFGGCGS
jgi:hypothetical protein